VIVRPAHPRDVPAIREMVDHYAARGILLTKATVTLYEDIQEFFVAVDDEQIIGCGALHVMWEDLAEVRTVAVRENITRVGVGSAILEALLNRARELDITRVFCLTFETRFFGKHGFKEIDGSPVDPSVYPHMLESYDEGVAEMLGLERVKPNTLGNHRMLLEL
jgi:amino-acid N-acetyltransferase